MDVSLIRDNARHAADLLGILANASRLQILYRLWEGECDVGRPADELGLSQSSVSQHLAKMRLLGLVDNRRAGRQVRYRVVSAEARALLSTLHRLYCAPREANSTFEFHSQNPSAPTLNSKVSRNS